MIQDAISDRNHPIPEDLFTEAKKQVLKYLEEQVYPGFLHCDILNSLYTILPEYILLLYYIIIIYIVFKKSNQIMIIVVKQ